MGGQAHSHVRLPDIVVTVVSLCDGDISPLPRLSVDVVGHVLRSPYQICVAVWKSFLEHQA